MAVVVAVVHADIQVAERCSAAMAVVQAELPQLVHSKPVVLPIRGPESPRQ